MKRARLPGLSVLVSLALVGGAGCGGRKTVTERQRKEAAHLASEAQFALTVHDFARAEATLAKAVALAPDDGALWTSLGAARVRLGQRDKARTAYQSALAAYAAEAKENPRDAEPWLRQAYVLALLGRKDDGRALAEKAVRQFPADRNVKAFIEGRHLDRMAADPAFREISL